MPKGDVHVVQRGQEWAVESEGSQRASSKHKTQTAAITAGRAQAKRNKSELLVHGRDGKIRDRSTYGNDPRRTKG
jgi:Uncharacterized protein conserved in bacteria (DUF2188)